MKLLSDPRVKEVFNHYPDFVQNQMLELRDLVLKTANDIEGLEELEETLKWNEPSYLTKFGSTLRMDWKKKKPDQYAMFFSCSSSLIPTFKAVFQNKFKFEGDRAIIFNLNDSIPINELKQCIKLALTYHKVKHLPLLGI